MKKRTKFSIGGLALLAGILLLSSCTQSFCSDLDQAHILYAFDYGVTEYYDNKVEDSLPLFEGNTNIYYKAAIPTNTGSGIGKAFDTARKSNIQTPTLNYYVQLDKLVLKYALSESEIGEDQYSTVTFEQVLDSLDKNGYLKFYYSKDFVGPATKTNKPHIFDRYFELNDELRVLAANPATSGISYDDLPTTDFVNIYTNGMKTLVRSYRSCIAITTDKYGYYGYANGAPYRGDNKVPVEIEQKTWGYAWNKGFFEGLLVFPISWLTETFVSGFKSGHVPGGLAQLLAILLITFIVRGLMLVVTLKQTTANAKMQALQPEITKIQNKYPNANTNNYEKQQMAAEMQKLYKKNKINPFSSLLVMIVQFPVFICVWGALQGSASLSSDSVFNLHLSDAISTVLFDPSNNWVNGSAVTALILFLLMSGAQVLSMLLPQFIQKAKRKKIASLGKNPAQNEQQNRMKMFTYIMMAMIIFMGFTLPSAMGVYWFVGALFSIAQTFVVEAINSKKGKKKDGKVVKTIKKEKVGKDNKNDKKGDK